MATLDFGIDLGTTNSSIASCRGGAMRLFQSTELMNVTPSVVYMGKSGRMLVGKKAYDAWPGDPLNTQAEFKRWMGFSDTLYFPAANQRFSAEQLSAEVLKALRADVQRATGEEVTAAVITVPAAFGALQCDATGRAAKQAGLLEAPLLQEPIAAAIAYGASAAGQAQRWLVFDLGGGTLDIAIVSTRNGRLAVLEHQGNNRLGGKDIDRAIADEMLWAPLAEQFKLPDRVKQPAQHDRLYRQIVRFAEQAKITLSTAERVELDLFNLGDDLAGMPIETTLALTRDAMESRTARLVEQCHQLVLRALEGARLAAADIDRVLLVGGPTQMPMIRAMLTATLGNKLDFSIDPMTVVAQGAALYASTLERTTPSVTAAAVAAPAPVARGTVPVKLNYERASGTLRSPCAGVLPADAGVHEVKIDAEGGVWSSGWLPVRQGRFVTEVLLTKGKPVTRFQLAGRTASGTLLPLHPADFSIAFMLPMAAPPLPHTLAVELTGLNGETSFDPVFQRHTPLPAEARKTYRADRTLRPSDGDASLPIKFWEIDVSEDPQEKWWAGCVHIRAMKLKRPLMAGSEIELTIKLDKSRKMTVEVFLPLHNAGFSDDVYVPDPPSTQNQLQQQLDLCLDRLDKVFAMIYAGDREDLRERAEMVQLKLEVIAEEMADEKTRGSPDPDALLGPGDKLRKLRVLITQLEEQLESERHLSPYAIKLRANHRWTQQLVEDHGNATDKETLERLTQQLQRYTEVSDARGLKYVEEQLRDLRANLLWNQPWFWENSLRYLSRPGQRFLNQAQAREWIRKANAAQEKQDFPALRDAVNNLWNLQPPDQMETAKEQAMQSGLKGN